MHEDLLCALSLPTNTTEAQLFKSPDGYIKTTKMVLCRHSTDGAGVMTAGLTARIKEVAPNSKSTHYVIYKEMLEFTSIYIYRNLTAY